MSISRREFLKKNAKALIILSLGSITTPIWIKSVYADNGPRLLRPPGAMLEEEFLNKCIRCFKCGEACPYGTIKFAGWRSGIAIETPYLQDLENFPCYLCMKCTEVCPTGALKKISNGSQAIIREVKFGIAEISDRNCVVINGKLRRCHRCIIYCPLKDLAIGMDEWGFPVIDPNYCVGCGICVKVCPYSPVAIKIRTRGEL